MTRFATYLAGAAIVFAVIPTTLNAQDVGGAVGGAVSGSADAASGGLGVSGGAEAGSNSGIGIDRDGMSIQNRTTTGVRADVKVEDEDEQDQAAAPREGDATVTGSVKSAIGGECSIMRDGICVD